MVEGKREKGRRERGRKAKGYRKEDVGERDERRVQSSNIY
jgi:hypothetical protein